MGPLTDFPDMDGVMAQVRSFLEKTGAGKHVTQDPASSMSVEPQGPGEDGDERPPRQDSETPLTGFGGGVWRASEPARSWGDHLPSSQGGGDGMDVDAADQSGFDDELLKPSTPFLGVGSVGFHDQYRTSPGAFPMMSGLIGGTMGRGVEFSDDEGEDENGDNGEDTPTDPTHFLYSVLVNCLNGLRSIQDSARTLEVARAVSVCRMGLDYVSIIDNGVARNETQNRYMLMAAATPPQPASTLKGKGRKGGRAKQAKMSTGGGRSLTLPAEILLRVFSFMSESDQSGASSTTAAAASAAATAAAAVATLGPVPASALYSCSLVCRQWDVQASTELWKRVTMDDDAPRLSRFVVSLASTALSGRNRGSLVRVISIACTDAELSLLALAASKLPGLHSLELRRSFIPNASSYRLLNRLRNRFPSLRSLVADMIPPTALPDIISIVRGATLLSNLHVSIGPPDHRGPTANITSSPETIQSLLWKIPNLRSISFWRVSLPRDEGLWVPALASSCPSLKAIRIDDCGDISMDILVGLWRRCDLLECISMRKVKRRTAFTELVPRQYMRRVVLDGCWMNDSLCAAIGRNAPNLEIFYIEDDWADDDFKHPLAPTVVNELTDAGVLELSRYQHNLRAITFIGFPGRRNFRASSLRQLLDSNPSCFALNLARMDPQWPYRMSDSWLLELSPSLRNIEILELYIQNGVTEEGLLETLRRASVAASFDKAPRIPGSASVDADGAIAAVDPSFVGTGRIRRLGLSGWSQLGDRTLFCIPVLCPRLERLDMAGANVSPVGLQSLVDAAGRLRECVVTVPPLDSNSSGEDGFGDAAVRGSAAGDDSVGVGGVRWGNVMQYDDPVSEDVFSPYSVWEREVRRLGKRDGIIY
ncbi:hypothetical protein HDU67_007287 [Dinochytrium kinnereticum]|nr:hypothetical protein HDU67_007287 [Dinochytrium kinnereticum]